MLNCKFPCFCISLSKVYLSCHYLCSVISLIGELNLFWNYCVFDFVFMFSIFLLFFWYPKDFNFFFFSYQLYAECGHTERSISILENHLKSHPSGADFGVIDLLAAILMETNAYNNALQHIEHAHQVYYSGKELPLELKIKAGICHVRLGNIEKAEVCTSEYC